MTVVHGGLDDAEMRAFGLDPAQVLDLSANLHPDGPSKAVRAAAASARIDRYPSADAAPLREAIAAHEGVPPGWVLPTAGATGAIHLLTRTLVSRGEGVPVIGPAFGEYAAAIEASGGTVLASDATGPGFRPPAPLPASVGFLTNPNNPTGAALDRGEVETIAARLGGLLVVDAAYEAFVREGWDAVDLVRDRRNVAVLRSMTKLHAIPGIRLGYIVAPPALIARLGALQPSWTLDAVAHAVAPVALGEHDARVRRLDEVWIDRDVMRRRLEDAGFTLGPSQANFLLIDVSEVGEAVVARRQLLASDILVRDCTSFGLPGWIRVAIPRHEHVPRVTDALLALGALRAGAPSA